MKSVIQLKPEIKKLIDTAIEKILSAGNPEKVFLFGSFAKGLEKEDSDLDLYIIEKNTIETVSKAAKYYKALFKLNHAKDIIVRSPEEFEKNKKIRFQETWILIKK